MNRNANIQMFLIVADAGVWSERLLLELGELLAVDQSDEDDPDDAPVEVEFTAKEVAEVRAGKGYSHALVRKLFEIADHLALQFYKAHPLKPKPPSKRSRYDTFNYRYAIAGLIYFLRWMKDSGQMKKPEKLRNDMVDINFATYGTYFNGVMTEDKRVRALELELRVVLGQVGARLPEPYFETLIAQLKAAPADPVPSEA